MKHTTLDLLIHMLNDTNNWIQETPENTAQSLRYNEMRLHNQLCTLDSNDYFPAGESEPADRCRIMTDGLVLDGWWCPAADGYIPLG